MSEPDLIATLRERVRLHPGLGAALHAILDRREQRGAMPGTLTLAVAADCVPLLRDLFSARAVEERAGGRVRLRVAEAAARLRGQSGLDLDELLYRALERSRRDPVAEEAALGAGLIRALGAITAVTGAAQRFLRAEAEDAGARRGPSHGAALRRWREGQDVDEAIACAAGDAERVARCMDLALQNRAPLRLQNFAARALDDPKALLEGSDLHTRLCDALLAHDPATAEEVAETGILTSTREARREALSVHHIFRDESTITAHCFGPLVYRKAGRELDHVAAHAALGECVPLSLQQLRGAEIADLPVSRVVLVENETSFLDYVEAAQRTGPAELVICARGQSNWAVVTLLRLVARYFRRRPGDAATVWHSGDLDRSGVLILRSLARRAGLAIAPLGMSVDVHRRYAARGRALAADERERLRTMLARDAPGALCHDLLVEIARTGVWLEQELFFHDVVLAGAAAHGPT